MKAYACCVKRRVASAGPLSEHNLAFDIRAVRDRIEGDRVRGEAAQLLRSLPTWGGGGAAGGRSGGIGEPGPCHPPSARGDKS